MIDPPGPTLTSPANPRLRALAGLRERRDRDRTGRLLIDGAREISRALEGGVTLVEAFVVVPLPDDPELAAAADALAARGVPITGVTAAALGRLAFGDRASGIVAVAAAPDTSLATFADRLPADRPALLAVLEDVEKPGNLGAVCRSADGAGVDGVIAATGIFPGADPWNPNAVRASLGTVFTLPLAVAPSADVLGFLHEHGIAAVAARVDGACPWSEADLRGPIAIVLGSEAYGLSATWRAADVLGVRLPMLGRADSLNVAAAAAVLLYEARRQRDGGAAGSGIGMAGRGRSTG